MKKYAGIVFLFILIVTSCRKDPPAPVYKGPANWFIGRKLHYIYMEKLEETRDSKYVWSPSGGFQYDSVTLLNNESTFMIMSDSQILDESKSAGIRSSGIGSIFGKSVIITWLSDSVCCFWDGWSHDYFGNSKQFCLSRKGKYYYASTGVVTDWVGSSGGARHEYNWVLAEK